MLKKNLFGDTEAYLIFDDTVINKKYGYNIELTRRQYSGNEHQVVCVPQSSANARDYSKVRRNCHALYIAYCRYEILHTIISFFSDRYYF